MLTAEEYKTILEHIEGLIVVDADARITYINKRLAQLVGIDPEEAVGQHVRDVIPTTKVHKTVETREPSPADFYFLKDHTIVSSRYPLYVNNQFSGVVEYDLFDNYTALKDFLKKVDSLSNELNYYKQELKRLQGNKYSIDNIVGESPAIRQLRQDIHTAARSNSTVLITGESGCGKELVAHSIHALGERSKGSFVRLNCSAIPLELFESELFGFEEGTFTNARKGGQTGKFQLANNGTLFLDEINQMPLKLQPKILRALQEKEIDKIGAKFPIPVNVRVIAAANQELRELVAGGAFREDLYYRLNVIPIRIPPLRERKEDIPLLVLACIENLNHFLQRSVTEVADEVFGLLQSYDWPGNVRELQNTLERVLNSIAVDVTRLEAHHFERFATEMLAATNLSPLSSAHQNPLEEVKRQAERQAILQALTLCGGNKSETAKLLKIPRPLLYQKMKRLGIEQ
ncbi:sigma-54 interaction domain-containing protein [Brevibacillus fluminis]|nr:sigma 54-interacting transcriptional regulator [Brevibacillus fluminis]